MSFKNNESRKAQDWFSLNINMIFSFQDVGQAKAFVAVIKNRLGLGVLIYEEEAKAHVGGADNDDREISRQVLEMARWLGAKRVTGINVPHPGSGRVRCKDTTS